MTPMQEQYKQIKDRYKDEVVLFRLGDFYEAFNTDAETLSHVLGITLTGRGKNDNRVPMAGIPHHALDNYLPKLVNNGYKVVVVDQLTEPRPGQLVDRGIAKIYTAGTLTEENVLTESANNYIASIYREKDKYALAFADVSTGKVFLLETITIKKLLEEVSRLAPSETILPDSLKEDFSTLDTQLTSRSDLDYEYEEAYKIATEQFKTTNLKGFGIEEMKVGVSALGALLIYLKECQRAELSHITGVQIYAQGDYMPLDNATIRNLELIYPSSGDDMKHTIFNLWNECVTNMGKRKLRDWLLRPLVDKDKLQDRWDSVDALFTGQILNSKVREILKNVADMERITGRIGVGSANARDLLALSYSLEKSNELVELLKNEKLSKRLSHLVSQLEITDWSEITGLIGRGIAQEPPNSITEGGIIASGYSSEVDELRSLRKGSKQNLAELQAREVKSTGISTLKVGYNKVFGYYIEVTKAQVSKVPDTYIRKQTLTNAERYITEELKVWEDKILTAEDRLLKLEYDLFLEIRNEVAKKAGDLLYTADLIAEIDVYSNFAYLAKQYRYTKPVLSDDFSLHIVNGRHPAIERLQKSFTPNDVSFDSDNQLIILTGPNMSGKSTYIRQVALLTLLAQIGSFVPADSMSFSLVDRIFTRVGASDNLSRGESTFMVEMNETANILNNATKDSLIILDEVGRGTSTYDGVAIAWAIVEYLVENTKARTLFATHYHELIELDKKYREITNYNVLVKEEEGNILFQHKIAKGSTSRSYGVHVASLAGVPKGVVKRAEEILERFEGNGKKGEEVDKGDKRKSVPNRPRSISGEQMGLI